MYHGISPFFMMAFLFAMVIGITCLMQVIDNRRFREKDENKEGDRDYSYDDLLDNLSNVYHQKKFSELTIQQEDFVLNHILCLMHKEGFENLDAHRIYVSHLLTCKPSALSEICLHEVEQQSIERLVKLPAYRKAYFEHS